MRKKPKSLMWPQERDMVGQFGGSRKSSQENNGQGAESESDACREHVSSRSDHPQPIGWNVVLVETRGQKSKNPGGSMPCNQPWRRPFFETDGNKTAKPLGAAKARILLRSRL